jgi:hypothetical protein
MRSSTSSSRSRRSEGVWHLALAVWVTLALVGFAALFAPERAATADIVAHQDPPAWGSFYLAHDRGGHVDHHVLFHGIDNAANAHLRAAEVLFLGNSRLMFALQPQLVREFFAGVDRRYYVLGFGHEEQDDFPLEIIRAHDLRPDLVVINADHFFAAEQSDWAARVIEESDFDAWKIRFEAEAAHRVRRSLHRIVPHYVDLRRGLREVVLYRSREDGSWFVATTFGEGARFDWPPPDRDLPGAQAFRAAEAFKRELDARGARIVLWIVPGPDVSLHRARAMAERLGVPLLVPTVDDLRTIDGSHLAEASARRVASALLEQLQPHLR